MLIGLLGRLLIWLCCRLLAASSAQDIFGSARMADREDRDEDLPRLKLAHILFRHGDRSPIRSYDTDLYTEEDWQQGYGQLSTVGMQQALDLGRFLRQTYIEEQAEPGFLSPDYDRSQVYVRSTSYDRTLMTVYSVLAGLYPPTGKQQTWNEDLPWQPIPVHTVPIEEDRMLITNVVCPAYDKASQEYRQTSPLFNDTVRKNQDLYTYVSLQTGYPPTWEGLGNVLDPIFCEYVSNYTLPAWVKEDVLDRLLEMRDIYSGAGVPPKHAFLKGGMLLGEMLEHMQFVSAGNQSRTEKLFLYSAHDSTVVLFLCTLGAYNNLHPPYTGAVMVELWEQSSQELTVVISYRNESESSPYPLKLPDCEVSCPLEKFIQLTQSSVLDDFEKACGITNDNTDTVKLPHRPSGTTIAVAILTGALLLVALIGGILCCVKKSKLQDNHDYRLVPMDADQE